MNLVRARHLRELARDWAQSVHAVRLLFVWSFLAAIVVPVPAETMLAPMVIAQPSRAYWYASISLGGALAGMLVGYVLGYFAVEWMLSMLDGGRLAVEFEALRAQMRVEGAWLLIVAGIVPLPIKLLTVAAGAVEMHLLLFICAALIGRGKRVFLVAMLARSGARIQWRALLARHARAALLFVALGVAAVLAIPR